MKQLLAASIAAATVIALGAAGPAQATLFSFTYSGGGVTGAGTLTADLIAPGEWLASSGTDTTSGGTVAGALTLFPNPGSGVVNSPSGFFTYDDLLFPGGNPALDNAGLLFVNGSGGEVNIFSNGPSDYVHFDNTGFNVPIDFALTGPVSGSIPEPVSLSLLGVGLIGLGVLRRRNAD